MLNRSLLYCLFICLLAACAPTALPQPTETAVTPNTRAATRPVTLATPRPSSTPAPPIIFFPTGTSTPLPGPIPTLVPTHMPISPVPTSTPRPTATRVSLPASYNLPPWVHDPQAAVLVTLLLNNADYEFVDGLHIALLNIDSGEHFELQPLNEFASAGWRHTGPDDAPVLNLRFWVPETPYEGHSEPFELDTSTGRLSQAAESYFGHRDREIAPGGRYMAEKIGQLGSEEAKIVDLESNQEIILFDPFNGHYRTGMRFEWSSDGSLLAVQRLKRWVEGEAATFSTDLAIYTVDGQLYRFYDGLYNWGWAPDGSSRLITTVEAYYINGEPCILDVQTSTTECLPEVVTWHESGLVNANAANANAANIGVTNIDKYQWLPDSSGLSFIYWNEQARMGGHCILDLSTHDISCPVNETILAQANDRPITYSYVLQYEWSPDGRYIVLEINPYQPRMPNLILTKIATIARDGSDFRVWGFGSTANYLAGSAWRPLSGGEQ